MLFLVYTLIALNHTCVKLNSLVGKALEQKFKDRGFESHVILTWYLEPKNRCAAINITYHIWDKVFKNGLSKICGRQPIKYLKEYGLLKQTFKFFKGCLPNILLGPFSNTLSNIFNEFYILQTKEITNKMSLKMQYKKLNKTCTKHDVLFQGTRKFLKQKTW